MTLTKESFIKRLSVLNGAVIMSRSQGKKYWITDVNEEHCVGKKESGAEFNLDTDTLYQAYIKNVKTTTELLKGGYITSRDRSSAMAILDEIRKMG